MSAHLERAQLLLQQSRPADAEREAMIALAHEPDQPLAHAYLALSRVDQDKKAEALEAARAALGLAPDTAFFHYVHAHVLHRLERDKESFAAITEAIGLDPDEEAHFALLASIHLARRDWAGALEAAERGLALNPEDVRCANLRSMALVRLGRKDEAMATVDFALERQPDNALSHANQGWNCLHRNDPRRAQEHFREALRLNPELEYARQGMLEALKARNPVYRGMLAYFLWMGRQSGKLQAVFIIGTFLGMRFVRELAHEKPQWGPVLWPVVILFYVFVYLSWTAGPMFNLLLRLNKFGRMVLSRDERVASNWFGLCFLTALGGLVTWMLQHEEVASATLVNGPSLEREEGVLLAIVGAVLSMCVAATFGRVGRARRILAWATAALAATGAAGIGLAVMDSPVDLPVFEAFVFGFLGFQVLANVIRR